MQPIQLFKNSLLLAFLLFLPTCTLFGQVDSTIESTYTILSNPKTSFVLKGENYATDFMLYPSPSPNAELHFFVNGQELRAEKGKANYSIPTRKAGTVSYVVHAKIIEKDSSFQVHKEFSYEVGVPSINLVANRMNVLYIGVDNPIEVSAFGHEDEKAKVAIIDGSIKRGFGNSYIVRVQKPGEITIVVTIGTHKKEFPFRVKRMPDPKPYLGARNHGDKMTLGSFKAQVGIAPVLEYFDFDAKCKMSGFEIVRMPKVGNRESATNRGARFNSTAKELMQKAAIEDIYLFRNLKCRCPGDRANRELQSFSIELR